jgi:nicotinamide-nucleotide amidase
MNAEIVSVGTELLLGQIVDTHAATMAGILADTGINCLRRTTVGDNYPRMLETIGEALSRADLVVAIGGLGPTQDDLTRDAIAECLGDRLVPVPEVEEGLRRFFADRKLPWSDTILRQAQRPESARLIDNPAGTAPGLICEKDGKRVIALPGPRNEFEPMAFGPVKEYLSTLDGAQVIHSRVLRICGLGESAVEARIAPLLEGTNPTIAPYAKSGEVHLRITAKAADRDLADRMIDPVDARIREILGTCVYGADATTLEQAVVETLKGRSETVAVAESLTGGWLGERITGVPGAGDVFLGGIISYSVAVKQSLLGVCEETLNAFGPVSAECASEMAEEIRQKLGTTYGVSLTGNAGPTSDQDQKPVGLVFVGVAGPGGTQVQEYRYRGGRDDIRRRSTQSALILLRDVLLKG